MKAGDSYLKAGNQCSPVNIECVVVCWLSTPTRLCGIFTAWHSRALLSEPVKPAQNEAQRAHRLAAVRIDKVSLCDSVVGC